MENLDEVIRTFRKGVDLCPPGQPARSGFLNFLASALKARFEQLGQIEDLENAILSNRETLTHCPPGHPDRSRSLNNLANSLQTRFEQLGQIKDLEEVISSQCEALTLCPPGHLNRAFYLNGLAIALKARFEQLGRIEDLEDAISSNREALTLRPPGHPNRSMSLNTLATALQTRFEQLGQIEDLEDAISSHREALTLRPPGHPNRYMSLINLASALKSRFEQLGQIEDLEEAISSNRGALTPGHPNRSSSLNNLAADLQTQFEQLGRIEDLEDAILSSREALTLRPPGHPNRSSSLNNLANSLVTRFKQLGRVEDLEDAILSHREALDLCPPGHLIRSMSLNNLANSLEARFEQLGQIEDLEDAISSNHEALTLHPPGHPIRSISLNNLANSLQARFQHLGQIEDLEDAILYCREALNLCPPGHPDRSMSLNNLANSLGTRFKQFRQVKDLEDAISSNRGALTLHPPGHPNRSMSLNNLATALRIQFEQLGRIEDLDDAISSSHEALTLRPPGHPNRSNILTSLANSFQTRFKQLGQIKDLEEGISFYCEALTLCPPGHPKRSDSLNNLACILQTRFEKLGQIKDLEAAILSNHEALTLCPPGNPDRSICLRNLATCFLTRFDQLHNMKDLDESFTLYEQAANDLTSTSWHRLHAALNWAANSQHYHHRSIISAYTASFHLLDRCFISCPTVQLQHKILSGSSKIQKSLASDAAAAAIKADDIAAAVELLEQGRAILWSKIKGYRHPLDELRQANSELADQFESISTQLEHLALSSNSGLLDSHSSAVPAVLDAQMQNHRILSEDWEIVVERVRQVEGFGNFLQAIPFATLQTAAVEGPIIIINISKYRSDAIILHAKNPPMLVTLPDLHPEDLTRLTKQLVFACNVRADANPSKDFVLILRNLWDIIVSPVVNCLTELGVQEKSRVWWCPTSELCALPLHAAGPYQPRQKNLPDLYISSYIPTLTALIEARFNTRHQAAVPKLIVVGQPGASLSNVQEEIDDIQQLGEFVKVIIGDQATPETVLDILQQNTWAHFACHGHLWDKDQQDKDQPFHAYFELHGDSRLTLLNLIQAQLPNAELAFLSACHSAASNGITPDETIHLAAALQFCGFRSVVGTLWEMNDEDGPSISKAFYKHMFRNGTNKADFRDSAEALSLAIREMRNNGVPLHRWIMFVHIGA